MPPSRSVPYPVAAAIRSVADRRERSSRGSASSAYGRYLLVPLMSEMPVASAIHKAVSIDLCLLALSHSKRRNWASSRLCRIDERQSRGVRTRVYKNPIRYHFVFSPQCTPIQWAASITVARYDQNQQHHMGAAPKPAVCSWMFMRHGPSEILAPQRPQSSPETMMTRRWP
jgi:hypothetical protein